MENVCAIRKQSISVIVGIPMIRNYATLKADLFLFYYERNFMSNSHKSKHYDLIASFYDISRDLVAIFTIDNREFEKYTPDAYPTELFCFLKTVYSYSHSLFRLDIIGHLQRVWLANGGRLHLRSPGPVPYGTCICSNVENIHS